MKAASRTSRRRRTKPQPQPGTNVTRGAKLRCIDDSNLRRKYQPGPPVRGQLYCVREVYTDDGEQGVLLVGIQGPTGPNGLEQGFYLSRFRWVHD